MKLFNSSTANMELFATTTFDRLAHRIFQSMKFSDSSERNARDPWDRNTHVTEGYKRVSTSILSGDTR